MRKEMITKEIHEVKTVTETKYIAFDGTEFNRERDCLDYEAEAVLKRDDVVVFDELKDCSPCFFDPYTDHGYIWVMPTTERAVELLDEYYNYYNSVNIKINHIYGIDYFDSDMWMISVDDMMTDIISFFKGMNIKADFIKENNGTDIYMFT